MPLAHAWPVWGRVDHLGLHWALQPLQACAQLIPSLPRLGAVKARWNALPTARARILETALLASASAAQAVTALAKHLRQFLRPVIPCNQLLCLIYIGDMDDQGIEKDGRLLSLIDIGHGPIFALASALQTKPFQWQTPLIFLLANRQLLFEDRVPSWGLFHQTDLPGCGPIHISALQHGCMIGQHLHRQE